MCDDRNPTPDADEREPICCHLHILVTPATYDRLLRIVGPASTISRTLREMIDAFVAEQGNIRN